MELLQNNVLNVDMKPGSANRLVGYHFHQSKAGVQPFTIASQLLASGLD